MFTLNALLLGLSAARLAFAVPAVTIEGADFINSKTGNRFQIVGVAYQPGGSSGYTPGVGDPLSDGDACLRDAALMQPLGVNSIRVYNVDPNLNHDLCMSIFNAVGIYVALDVNSPLSGESINRAEPWTTYTDAYLNRVFQVVEAFKNYPNTLLFFSGNEVINDNPTGGIDGPYMRAVTRDMKNYIANNVNRTIPVGYSAADVRDILVDTWNYLQCTTTGDTKDPARVDLFALNSYSWCGAATYKTSGYDIIQGFFKTTSVPVFFSEYGCNEVKPRIFTEVEALYGSEMTQDISGGMVYEYAQEDNNYGLVKINSDGTAEVLGDYDTLQKRYNALDFTRLQGLKPSNTTNQPPKCDSSLITNSAFSSNFTLPETPSGAAASIKSGIKFNNIGKLVPVTVMKVKQQVKASSGSVMTGLAIKPVAADASNAPSGVTTSNSTNTTAGAAAASSGKSAATGDRQRLSSFGGLAAGLIAAVAFL